MRIVVGAIGAFLVFIILLDAFETIILPRRVTRELRPGRAFIRWFWRTWAPISEHIRSEKTRETYLSYFGPLALLLLFAFWGALLVLAFALLQWAGGSAVEAARGGASSFRTDLYLSGTTFTTLGLGDVLPLTAAARVLVILEAGIGLGFLAIVITYLPTLYGAFSQRERNISLLDSRAGSPPTAGELLRRYGRQRITGALGEYLRGWEVWSAEVMESHLTYPILCWFRSQHHNQSWLAALTSILDICSLIIAYGEGDAKRQAQLTFITARHAVADIAEVLSVKPAPPEPERLSRAGVSKLRALIIECGVPCVTPAGDAKLTELRAMYEPIVNGLSARLRMPLPPWCAEPIPHPRPTIWERVTSDGPAGGADADAAGTAGPSSGPPGGTSGPKVSSHEDSHF